MRWRLAPRRNSASRWAGPRRTARVTLEPVYCLGLCHSSPAAMLDKDVFGMLDEHKLDQLLKEAQA